MSSGSKNEIIIIIKLMSYLRDTSVNYCKFSLKTNLRVLQNINIIARRSVVRLMTLTLKP